MERGGEGESREGKERAGRGAPYFFPSSADSFAMNRATTQRRHIFKGFQSRHCPRKMIDPTRRKILLGIVLI
jgi:hypothetical protein